MTWSDGIYCGIGALVFFGVIWLTEQAVELVRAAFTEAGEDERQEDL